jgi:hypothetical protein
MDFRTDFVLIETNHDVIKYLQTFHVNMKLMKSMM